MSMTAVLWTCLALLVIARGVLALVPSMWMWGLNVQRFLDPLSAWGLWLFAALTMIPALAARLARPLDWIGDAVASSKRGDVVAWIGGALLVAVLPDRTWFVGDFLIRQGNVELGVFAGNYLAALPLDYLLHSAILRPFGAGSTVAANDAARVLGAIEAGFLAVLSLRFARALGATGALAVLAAATTFLGGWLTMFTGLGKPASELCLVVLALAAFGTSAVRNRTSLLPFGIVMALAMWLHRSSVFLIPAWLVVVWLWSRGNPNAWKRPSDWVALLLPTGAAAAALPTIVGLARSYDLSHHILTPEAKREGGLWAEVFAPRHLLDLVNLAASWSPLVLALPVLIAGRARDLLRRPEATVLLTLAAGFVPALLLVQPQQGIFRDADVFAPAGMACAALMAYVVVERLRAAPGRAWLAVSVAALAMVSALQWLVLNADAGRGLSRVHAYLLEPPGPEVADRPLVWDFLAARNMRIHRWSEAADAAAHAAQDAPHRRVLLMWALSETMNQNPQAAERIYHGMLVRDSEDPLAWIGLAGVARRVGDQAALDSALAKLRSYAPQSHEMQMIRRHLRYYPQVWEDSTGLWSPVAVAPRR